MHGLVAVLIPIIIVIAVGIIAIAVTERFSPDPLITTIVRWVVCCTGADRGVDKIAATHRLSASNS